MNSFISIIIAYIFPFSVWPQNPKHVYAAYISLAQSYICIFSPPFYVICNDNLHVRRILLIWRWACAFIICLMCGLYSLWSELLLIWNFVVATLNKPSALTCMNWLFMFICLNSFSWSNNRTHTERNRGILFVWVLIWCGSVVRSGSMDVDKERRTSCDNFWKKNI